ncbi:MAG: T9SS type A sorting domain-containing protein [Calditrichaeota bacterium]|nr:T9SS type A sorting domain-containing protein [Calditrichota bacterium]
MKKAEMLFAILLAILVLANSSWAAEVNSASLGDNGWYSDDTRADGSGTQAAGTNLVSPTLTDVPENGSGNAAHDSDILSQLLYGPAPAGFPGGTHPGAVNLWIDAVGGASGKSQISHRKDDLSGFGPGSILDDPGFFVDYYWMGNGGANFSAAFKIGFKTSEFGLTSVSSRTGENVWDKLLIYEPNNLGAHPSNGTWWHEQVSRTSGTWWVFDRVRGYFGQPQYTLASMETSTDYYGGNATYPTYGDLYDLMANGIITSVQLGVGSANAGANVYVNQLETSFYRVGDVTTFGPGYRVHNITQSLDYFTIQSAINAANPGDVIECDAGTYSEAPVISIDLTLRGDGQGSTIIDATGAVTYGLTVDGDVTVLLEDFSLAGPTNSTGYGIKATGENQSISIHDVTVYDSYRTGIDLNGVSFGDIQNCTVTGTTHGNGFATTDCDNVTFSNITTSGNAWGGVAVYTYGRYYTGGSDNVAFSGTLNISEPRPIYTERDEYASVRPPITNLTVPLGQFPYIVGDASYPYLEAYVTSQLNAVGAANLLGANGWAYDRAGTFFYVEPSMTGQAAATAAASTWATEATENEIHFTAGTFPGQIHAVGMPDLVILGAGVGSTIIQAPTTAMPDFYTTSANNFPVLFLDGCTADVSDLTLDGDGKGNINNRFQGIAFWNSSGSLTNVDVIDVTETPFSGNQHGLGIYAFNNTAGPFAIDITDVNVTGYQKGGIALNGNDNLTANLLRVTTVGAGPTGVTAQNGIQMWGSGGTITDCDVTGNAWTGGYWVACGYLLLYGSNPIIVTDCDGTNNQVTFNWLEMNGSQTGGTIVSTSGTPDYISAVDVTNYGSSRSVREVRPSPYDAEGMNAMRDGRIRNLDANQDVTISGVTMTGTGLPSSYGVYGYCSGDNLDIEVSNCTINDYEYGVLSYEDGGTITQADVTGNTLNCLVPGYDNVSGHYWDSNCYSNFGVNDGYPTTYEVPGAAPVNVDANPNPACGSTISMTVSVADLGCGGTDCDETNLYISTDIAQIPNLQLVLQLPTGFAVNTSLPGTLLPFGNADPNLISVFANNMAGNQVVIDMGFQSPGSSGDGSKFIACLPLVNVSAATGTYPVSCLSSLWIDSLGGNHTNTLIPAAININVDCTPPTITDFVNNATCSFGSASQVTEMFSATLDDANSDLEMAWVTFAPGGGSYQIFGPSVVPPTSPNFPVADDSTVFYGYLQEGCNTLTLHLLDTECNETMVDLLNVGRDNTAPGLSVTDNLNGCYNNATAEAALEADLDIEITQLDLVNCNATTGTLTITSNTNPGGTPYTLALSGDLSGFPGATYSAALWTWMNDPLGGMVPTTADGETYEFSAVVNDCAGNVSGSQTFDLCIDFVLPGNTVTTFDARPADGGVWLNWEWTPDVSQAVELRIYRSPFTTGSSGYPSYSPQLLNNYDVSTVPPTGWTLVATQLYGTGEVSSATETGNNNRLDFHQHLSYWLDAELGWKYGAEFTDGVPSGPDATSWRDIYRYVTFVKDAAGNWSTGYTTNPGTNVDHATNYWLGDFAPADNSGLNNSRGKVDTDDLQLLSGVYFGTGTYQNIGPVQVENGNIGKGIPIHNGVQTVNFSDLVPFSFNYEMVGRYSNPLEFMIEPDPSVYRPVNRLDSRPVVALDVLDEPTFEAGSEFTVAVSVSGNDGNVVKAVQAMLNFDDTQLEVVTTSIGGAVSSEGTVFAKVSETAEEGQVGLVAAACGGWTTLDGNMSLGTVTFRVKTELTSDCEIELADVQLFDNTGEIIDIEGETYPLFSVQTVPDNYALYQNYPNPFNPTTNIQFDLKEAGHVKIMVYNTLGQLVALAADNDLTAGRHTVSFDASRLASGVYIYSINVNGFSDLKKMVLIK